MTATTIRVQMAQRKDTAANWTAANPILLSGEIGYETDTKKFKIGNGSTNWNSLAYLPIPDGSGNLTITGNLEIGSTGSLTFEGSTADGFETTLAVTNPTADRTITLPDRSGTVITSGDTGTVTSTMILDGTIVNGDVNASAAIAGTKITPDFGAQTITTTGVVSAAVGAAATPSITFTGDTNTGIYSPGADQVAISTGGSGRLFINSDGTISVGDVVTGNGGVVVFNASGQTTANLSTSINNGSFIVARHNDANGGAGGAFVVGAQGGSFAAIKGLLTDGSNNTAGDLAFSTRATSAASTLSERLRITSAGLVGIGTSSPSRNLDITAGQANVGITSNTTSAGNEPTLVFTHAGNNSYVIKGGNNLQFASDAGTNVRMTLTTAGSLGIGSTNPSHLLTVTASAGAQDIFLAGQGGVSNGYQITSNGTVLTHKWFNSGSEAARIDSSGRLLVGTSSARTYLGAGISAGINVEAAGNLGANNRSISIVNGFAGSDDGDPIIYLGRTRSDTIGGTTVVQNGDSIGRLEFIGSDGTNMLSCARIAAFVDGTPGANDMPGRLVFSTTADGAISPTERMRITNDGAIWLGANVIAQATGTVDGGTFYSSGVFGLSANNDRPLFLKRRTSDGSILTFNRDNTQVGDIFVSTTATSYVTTSDYRLKENVTPVTDGINRLQQLKPSRFNFIAEPGKTMDGFLAHEAAEVVPECVTGEKDAIDADGNPVYQGIDQAKLVPLLTAALQEAIGEIESLKARVAALESA